MQENEGRPRHKGAKIIRAIDGGSARERRTAEHPSLRWGSARKRKAAEHKGVKEERAVEERQAEGWGGER